MVIRRIFVTNMVEESPHFVFTVHFISVPKDCGLEQYLGFRPFWYIKSKVWSCKNSHFLRDNYSFGLFTLTFHDNVCFRLHVSSGMDFGFNSVSTYISSFIQDLRLKLPE